MTSISSNSLLAIPTLSASLAALAAAKRPSDVAAQSDTLQPKQVIAKADSYAQSKAESAVDQDTQDLASTITATFQAILGQRPDLAHAAFDFTGGKDGIKVTSGAMNEKDRVWLEEQLNASPALLDMVNRFNSDLGKAVDGAAAIRAREATPSGMTPPTVSAAQTDHTVPFLAFLQGVVSKAAPSSPSSDTTYTDRWGRTVDLRNAKTTSLAGMIDAKRQLDALQDGSIVARSSNGRVLDGAYFDLNPYAATAGIAAAYVPSVSWSASSTSSHAAVVRAITQQVSRKG